MLVRIVDGLWKFQFIDKGGEAGPPTTQSWRDELGESPYPIVRVLVLVLGVAVDVRRLTLVNT